MFLSPDGKVTILPERQSPSVIVCPSWNHQNIILLEADKEHPEFSILSEFQPNGELCRRSDIENNDEEYNQRRVPFNVSKVKSMCSESLRSVVFVIQGNRKPVVCHAEWRFQEKCTSLKFDELSGSVTLFDGAWFLKQLTEGSNCQVGYIDFNQNRIFGLGSNARTLGTLDSTNFSRLTSSQFTRS
jgi:hypothetical protein